MLTLIKKISEILPPADKSKLILLFIFMLIAGALEVLGIGLILAFISIISTPDKIMSIAWLAPILNNLGIVNSHDMLVYGSVSLIGIFLFKNSYIIIFNYVQVHFVYNRFRFIATRLFEKYMNAPYIFHLGNNTARLIRNITIEINLMVRFVMLPILVIIMEIVMMTGIIIFLIIIEPFITFISLIFMGIAGVLFLKIIKSKISLYGAQSLNERARMIQKVNEGLGGFKEISVKNRQSWFIERFHSSAKVIAKAETFHQIAQQVTKPIIETVAVTSMLLVALILVWQGRGVESVIPVLTLFGLATFKLMPSVTKIISNYNSIKYYRHTLTPIHEDLTMMDKNNKNLKTDIIQKEQKINLIDTIKLKNISYSYPGSCELVLKDLSLTISRGAAVGFVGGSGAGKTTIIDLILGLLNPDQGDIIVDNKNIKNNISGWQKNIGYIPQFIYLADNTIRNNIAFGLDEKEIDEEQLLSAVKMAQLGDVIKRLPKGLDTMIGERGVRLSGGQRQRIGIARALYNNPEILIMDEATSSLDNRTEKYIIQSIERLKKGRTIIIIAHRLTTVKNCDKLFLIKDGRVVDMGSYDELIEKSTEFNLMIKCDN